MLTHILLVLSLTTTIWHMFLPHVYHLIWTPGLCTSWYYVSLVSKTEQGVHRRALSVLIPYYASLTVYYRGVQYLLGQEYVQYDIHQPRIPLVLDILQLDVVCLGLLFHALFSWSPKGPDKFPLHARVRTTFLDAILFHSILGIGALVFDSFIASSVFHGLFPFLTHYFSPVQLGVAALAYVMLWCGFYMVARGLALLSHTDGALGLYYKRK